MSDKEAVQETVAVKALETEIINAIDEYRESLPRDSFGPHGWPTIEGIKDAVLKGIRSSLSQSDPAPEIAALRAEIERLREALKPFADAAADYDGMPPPKYFGDTDFETRYPASTKVTVTVGQLREARAAVAPRQEEVKP